MVLSRQIDVDQWAAAPGAGSNRSRLVQFRSWNRCYEDGMNPFAIKLLGFAAATCTTLAFAPQFLKVWKTRSTEDISLGMFLVLVLGVALWLLYGLLSGDAPLVASNAITLVLAGGILFMKLKYG
jgi:MtN3 and saliva related transmembrane protein